MSGPEAALANWVKVRFGVSVLREGQIEVIAALRAGQRVLFVAPTGHGKSLTYQALAADGRAGVVIVFQPLKALMAEQAERAVGLGLRAKVVSSDHAAAAQRATLEAAGRGEVDILFVAPERLDNELWQEMAPSVPIKGIVIDEAHCISQWGHDFRPAYRRLVRITGAMGLRTPILAVTATAPPAVVEDIRTQIAPTAPEPVTVRLPSHRPNLRFVTTEVSGFAERLALAVQVSRAQAGAGITYVLTTQEARMAARFLCEQGIRAAPYYGRLEGDERQGLLEAWNRGDVRVVVATSALGMGVDRRNLRWVLHLGLPDSLIRYVQEVGRAGRDGADAWAIAVHDPELADVYEWLVGSSQPDPADYEAIAAELRTGADTRTALLERLDIPSGVAQRILNDLVENGLCRRSGSPFRYRWEGGGHAAAPEYAASVRALRRQRLDEALAYVRSAECRAVHLARAMGDASLPPCGRCDRCGRAPSPLDRSVVAEAEGFLARWRPDLDLRTKEHSRRLLEPGKALSLFELGPVGRAVADAKRRGVEPPAEALNAAREVLADPGGPYAGIRFDAVVSLPSTRSGPFVTRFAEQIAGTLRVPHVGLVKTRVTKEQKQFRSKVHQARNIRGALALPMGSGPFTRVLLVDDLLDSGETLKEAARVLAPATVFPLVMACTRDSDEG